MLKNGYLAATIGVDAAENEPSKVCRCIHAIPTPPVIPGPLRRAVDLPAAVAVVLAAHLG